MNNAFSYYFSKNTIMVEEKQISSIIEFISNRFSDENDKEIFRSVILEDFVKMPYIDNNKSWTVCGQYIDLLEEKIDDNIVNKVDSISFESFVDFSYGVEDLRSKLHKLTCVEEQLFFWLAKLNEKARRKHILESMK